MKLKFPKLNLQVDLNNNLNLLLVATTLLSAGFKYYQLYKESQLIQTYNRQARGMLTKTERILQTQNTKYNTSNAELVLQNYNLKAEADTIRKKYSKISDEFSSYVKKNNLELKQYERRIYSLKQKIRSTPDAKPKVVVKYDRSKCDQDLMVDYHYSDPTGRATFYTPNCLDAGGEILSLNQSFVVFGEVYQQSDGFLKVSSLSLSEVSPDDHSIVFAQANLVNSEFKYKIDPPPKKVKHLLLSTGLTSNKDIYAGLGYILYNYGKYDLSASIYYGTKDFVHTGLSLGYTPTIFSSETNFNFQLGSSYSLNNYLLYTLGVGFVLW